MNDALPVAIPLSPLISKTSPALHKGLVGYITILAKDIEDAKTFVRGNPVYEAGGTVEVRELPKS